MLQLTAQTRILVAIEPIDFRKQIDGVIALCKQNFDKNPHDGAYYVFINRRKTMVRILTYDGSGYWLATKRLSQGHFQHWPLNAEQGFTTLAARELRVLLKTTTSQNIDSTLHSDVILSSVNARSNQPVNHYESA